MAGLLASLTAALVAGCAPPSPSALPPPDTIRVAEQTGLALVLNLPAFRLDLRDGEDVVRSYTVAIGSRRYRTPLGRFAVHRVELNPWWYPPPSPWARRDTITPPGPRNPMGRAKLNFHELYFLHGTPQERSLGSAASHGCVRMSNADALDLARRVMAAGRPDVAAEEIEALVRNHRRTRRYALRRYVPLEIVYRTAEVRGGALELHPDVYRRERSTLRSRALRALREAGIDEEWVDAEQLGRAVRGARSEHVRVALDELLRAPAPRPVPPPDAERALALARRHTAHCFIGRGNARPHRSGYITHYWTGSSGMTTSILGEDCVSYNPATVGSFDRGALGWRMEDGAHLMPLFDNRADAERGPAVARAAGGRRCMIGRDNTRPDRASYIIEYWL